MVKELERALINIPRKGRIVLPTVKILSNHDPDIFNQYNQCEIDFFRDLKSYDRLYDDEKGNIIEVVDLRYFINMMYHFRFRTSSN